MLYKKVNKWGRAMRTIGFIGAGRLGTAFGIYLARHGEQVSGYYSRTYAHAQRSAELASGTSRAFATVEEVVIHSDWLAITTNDGAISDVVVAIMNSGASVEGKCIFHMSGACTSELLEPLAQQGAKIASVHPLQSFADGVSGADAMKQAIFSIESPQQDTVEQIKDWLDTLDNRHFELSARQKPLYHAAASIASNSLVGVIDYALQLMKRAGIEEEYALPALLPLVENTVQNVRRKGTAQALTGPVARGDVHTINQHLQALNEYTPTLVSMYQALGMITLATAQREQLRNTEVIAELEKLFKNYI
jgi:predicted short-subunit dehydrogenase-like oxidoreductase (DUF2520 family)